MRIPALPALAVLFGSLAALAALAGPASAANRNGEDYVVPGSYIVVLEDSVQSVSRQLAEHERREGFDGRRVYRISLRARQPSGIGPLY